MNDPLNLSRRNLHVKNYGKRGSTQRRKPRNFTPYFSPSFPSSYVTLKSCLTDRSSGSLGRLFSVPLKHGHISKVFISVWSSSLRLVMYPLSVFWG